MFSKLKKQATLLTVILVICVSATTWGHLYGNQINRTGTISGTLTDQYTRLTISGAEVGLSHLNHTTITDNGGNFIFKDIPVGSYAITFSYPGMVPQVKTDIIVKSGRISTVAAEIEFISQADESITVTAGYFNQAASQSSNSVNFSQEEIRRAPGSAGDISRIISSLPSIARVSDQANSLVVRGGSPHENLFLIDNIQVPNINHFPFQGTAGGAISLINVDFIEDVEFFAGGFSTIYGDRLSSVMNLGLREGNREQFNSQLSLDFSGAGLVSEGPLPGKKGSWMVSARRSYLDLLTNILDAGAAVQYSDFQGKVVYQLSQRSKLTLLGLMGLDKSRVTREDAIDLGETLFGDSRNRQHTIGLNWFWMWSDKGYADTSLSHSFTRYDYDFRKTAFDTPFLENLSEDESIHLRSVSFYNFNHAQKLRFGFEGQRITSRYNYTTAAYTNALGLQVPKTNQNIQVPATQAAAFVEYSLTLFSHLTLNLGLRADYFSHTEHTGISPRTSLVLKLSDRTSLSASAGIFRQHLPLLLLYRNPTNKVLREPRANHLSIGFNHLLGESLRLSIETYYKSYKYFPVAPEQQSLCLLDDLYGFTMFGDNALSDQGKARSYGIEFVLQKKLKEKVYGMISGSLFRTQYRDLTGTWRDRGFDNRYIFAVQGGYKPNKKWEYSIRWVIAGGMPYTPFNLEASQAANSGIYDEARINANRMPAYHSLNFRVDRRYNFRGSNLIFYLSLWNAYNRKNPASYYWNEVENKPGFTYQFSMLPVFGFEYEF